MAKRKPDEPKKGAPEWQTTFGDLMNLLLCFFVLLFAMSSIDEDKQEQIIASFNNMFSVFDGGATAIGDGMLISNGVSQLNELDQYINSTGKMDEKGEIVDEDLANAQERLEEAQLEESEELAEKIQEAVDEKDLGQEIDIEFTSQYVELTLKGGVLFDSGSVVLKDEALPVLDQVGLILERYAQGTIEIEGHTDNVPMSGAKYSNNDELSSGRALSVFNYLLSVTNLNPAEVKHAGRGEYLPIADNSTAEGRSRNRRVEIKIYNSLSSYYRIESVEGEHSAMKKNLISIVILALLIVNIVLSAIMMFSVVGESRKTSALVNNIATALHLELSAGNGEGEAAKEAIPMSDIDTYDISEKMTIPLKVEVNAEGEEEVHYFISNITLSMNTKDKGYKKYSADLENRESLIKGEINDVISQHTVEDARNNQAQIGEEILARIQKLFDSEFIFNVTFSDTMVQ